MDEKTREKYVEAIVNVAEARECKEFYDSVGEGEGRVEMGTSIAYYYNLKGVIGSIKKFEKDSFLANEREKLYEERRKLAKRLIE